MSLQQLCDATGLSDNDLTRVVQSLTMGKFRPLLKEGDDVVKYNKDFKAKNIKIKINAIQIRETVVFF